MFLPRHDGEDTIALLLVAEQERFSVIVQTPSFGTESVNIFILY